MVGLARGTDRYPLQIGVILNSHREPEALTTAIHTALSIFEPAHFAFDRPL
jgi:hypothetical protein